MTEIPEEMDPDELKEAAKEVLGALYPIEHHSRVIARTSRILMIAAVGWLIIMLIWSMIWSLPLLLISSVTAVLPGSSLMLWLWSATNRRSMKHLPKLNRLMRIAESTATKESTS